jgi:hypothetical protein
MRRWERRTSSGWERRQPTRDTERNGREEGSQILTPQIPWGISPAVAQLVDGWEARTPARRHAFGDLTHQTVTQFPGRGAHPPLHRGKEEVARCKFAAVGELPESMELVAGVKGKSEHRKLKKGIGKTGTGDELNHTEEIFF